MQPERKIIFQSEAGPRALRKSTGAWKIFGIIETGDPKVARAELEGGASGLVLKTLESVNALRHLPLHTFSIRNEAGDEAAKALVEVASTQPIDPARLDICFGVTPTLATEISQLGFNVPFCALNIPATTAANELGDVLKNAGAAMSFGTSSFPFSVKLFAGKHMFNTLAKFRAMRILWEQAFPSVELNLHAEISAPIGESVEHYMQGSVSACMGAGLGGADSIAILPIGNDREFDQRLVRNIQNILIRECHFGEVADASAGSGYVEQLTREIGEAAWRHFQS